MRPILTDELALIKTFGEDLIKGTSQITIELRYFHTATHVGGDDTDYNVGWSEGPFDCDIKVQGFRELQTQNSASGSTYTLIQNAIIKFPWKYFDGTVPLIVKNAPTSIHHRGVMGVGFTISPIGTGIGSAVEGVNNYGGLGEWEVISAAKGVADGVEFMVNNTETIGGASLRNERSGVRIANLNNVGTWTKV